MKDTVYKTEALELSNLFFFIPLIIAINYNIYWYAIIIFVVILTSIDFHFFNQAKEVYYLDVVFSVSLMIASLTLLFWGNWTLPYSAFAILLAISALYFYSKKAKARYNFNHSLWHIFSAGTCVFCLITFLSGSLPL